MSDPAKEKLRTLLARRAPLPIPDVLPDGDRIETAVLVPLVIGPEPSVTLVVRAAGLRDHAGEVSFPGGKREEADTTLADTALREAQEEIGLPVGSVDIIGTLSPVPVATSRYRIHPFVGWVLTRPRWKQSGEVARVLDVPLAALAEGRIAHQAVEMTWAGHRILSPFFVFEDDTRLYGATAYVLVELMSVVGPVFGFELPAPKIRR
jgi:8-oxo-dGTP pyrophosphatase MutT (NUDIX family)